MIKYRYTIDNTTIETLETLEIPEGVAYETIEFEIEETDDSQFELELLKQQAHQQLSETDWYVTRFAETGKPIPSNILELRNKIRNNI